MIPIFATFFIDTLLLLVIAWRCTWLYLQPSLIHGIGIQYKNNFFNSDLKFEWLNRQTHKPLIILMLIIITDKTRHRWRLYLLGDSAKYFSNFRSNIPTCSYGLYSIYREIVWGDISQRKSTTSAVTVLLLAAVTSRGLYSVHLWRTLYKLEHYSGSIRV